MAMMSDRRWLELECFSNQALLSEVVWKSLSRVTFAWLDKRPRLVLWACLEFIKLHNIYLSFSGLYLARLTGNQVGHHSWRGRHPETASSYWTLQSQGADLYRASAHKC